MTLQSILPPLAGGAIIGLAALIMMFFNGRIAGISGIFKESMFPQKGDFLWRIAFVLGLLLGGLALTFAFPVAFPKGFRSGSAIYIAAGLLVGFGTSMGSGCTSGHGVCGVSRLSVRSIIATLTFIATGGIAVFLMKMFVWGAGQ